jgi:hypothetical protein
MARRGQSRGLARYERAVFRIRLSGDLDRNGAVDLEQAPSAPDGKRRVVDGSGIDRIGAAGRELFDGWRMPGVTFAVTTGARARTTTHKVLPPDITGW